MPLNLYNNADWKRSVERQVGGHEYTNLLLDSTINTGSTPILPGYVASQINGVVKLADKDVDGGAFTGLFFSEVSSDIDELAGKTIPPVLIVGPAMCFVANAALDDGETYAVTTTMVELVAGDDGVLIPRGANTGPTVAHLVEVSDDGILINLLAPRSAGASDDS